MIELERLKDGREFTSGETIQQDPSVLAFADTQAAVSIIVAGTTSGPTAAAALHTFEAVKDVLGLIRGRLVH